MESADVPNSTIAAGATSSDDATSARPERVDRDLRISSPTSAGSEGPVRRTERAGTTGATAAVMRETSGEGRGSGRGEGEEDVLQAALPRPELGEHVTAGGRHGPDVGRRGALDDQRAVDLVVHREPRRLQRTRQRGGIRGPDPRAVGTQEPGDRAVGDDPPLPDHQQ